jgi:hypothetical protein
MKSMPNEGEQLEKQIQVRALKRQLECVKYDLKCL